MMAVKWIVLSAVLVAAFVVVLAVAAPAEIRVGDKAPDFTLANLDGKSTVKLSSYTDKPTLLVFWVSWCSHCRREAPIVQKVYNDLKSKGMNEVGIGIDEDLADARGFVSEYNLTFPNAYAGNNVGAEVLERYGVTGTPTLYVIGSDGMVKARFLGETSEAEIKEAFDKLGVK